mgnify:CR=1 FL=1|jgi:phage antirepressor YoqD-like protein|nr:MAG TPA_asm: antirepressor protein [Caudoviricetes sp.]
MNNKNETIKLGRSLIRVIRDSTGGVQRLNLGDLCSFLSKDLVKPRKNAFHLCPTSVKMPFRLGGRRAFSVTVAEIQTLTDAVCSERPELESRCREMEKWAMALNQPKTAPEQPEVPGGPVTYVYRNHIPISFRVMDGRMMVNATQMTKGYMRQPLEWFRLKETSRLRQDLAAEGLTAPYEHQIITTRGRNNGATWIEAPLALELALWLDAELMPWCKERMLEIDPDYKLPSEPFHRTVAKIERPHPKQAAKSKEKFTVPKTFSEALMLAAELQGRIERDGHKIAFYEDLIENRDWFSTTRLAEELRTTAHQLNCFLQEWDVCRYIDKQWIACPQYKHLQVDVPYMGRNKRGKYYKCGSAPRWNQEGREYIIKLWRSHNRQEHE